MSSMCAYYRGLTPSVSDPIRVKRSLLTDLCHDNKTNAILYRYIQPLSGKTNLDENGGDLEDPHQGQIEPSLCSLSPGSNFGCVLCFIHLRCSMMSYETYVEH
jgi:hypothetical protein